MAISQIPAAPNRNMQNAQFVAVMDAFLASLPNFVNELNAMGTALNLATSTTSSSSNSISTGAKTFTVPAGLGYVPGMAVTVGATASGTNNMSGTVTSYSGTSLVLNITAINGSGAFSAWNIALSPSASGASLGTNTFSGVQNFASGTDIASAATINLTTATGNTANVTGTTPVSAVTLGNGQWRQIIYTGACPLTYNATNHKLNTGGANYTTAPGDSVFYMAHAGIVYGFIEKLDGTSVVPNAPAGEVAFFALSSAPTGWLKANGAAVSRTVYANLFAQIGTTYGVGDGSTTFTLPDLRGYFLRGWDDSRGVDASRVLGSGQGDAIRNITGTFAQGGSPTTTGAFANSSSFSGTGQNAQPNYIASFDASRVVPVAGENRPINVAFLICIKY